METLASKSEDAFHDGVVEAFGALANAMEFLVGTRDTAPGKLRDIAKRLGDSPAAPALEAGLAKEGFAAVLQSLVTRDAPSGRAMDYQSAVEALSRSIEALRVDLPLLGQRSGVAATFRASADAVSLALGGELGLIRFG